MHSRREPNSRLFFALTDYNHFATAIARYAAAIDRAPLADATDVDRSQAVQNALKEQNVTLRLVQPESRRPQAPSDVQMAGIFLA
ncbi:hypothetical protein NGK11_17495 [Raoultella ornithinolytica]|uniref:hypothetical protein n=1 Tax=Raoultella ornithinolytica TaxID=54291 RepID=UPI002DB7D1BE|nr:hypothetical protein [Raoultella ornithinolytica]MEB8018225.1 hypothetical protein [Raoultella ornithinolytica]